MTKNKRIAIFQKKEIRKIIYNNEWWFVINDIIVALTDSKDPAQYYKRMKSRDKELKKLIEQGGGGGTICTIPSIEKRMRGISIREELTDEWKQRGTKDQIEYAILTAEITRTDDSQGFNKLKQDAKDGGDIAGDAKKARYNKNSSTI